MQQRLLSHLPLLILIFMLILTFDRTRLLNSDAPVD
jgi:hypothetical protein